MRLEVYQIIFGLSSRSFSLNPPPNHAFDDQKPFCKKVSAVTTSKNFLELTRSEVWGGPGTLLKKGSWPPEALIDGGFRSSHAIDRIIQP
jgi:hypothetical protein